MIGELVFKHEKKSQQRLSVAGTVIGLILMLLGIQIYLDLNRVLISPSIMGKDFLVLNKQVSMFGAQDFTTEELEDMKAQPFILEVAFIESNQFESYVEADMGPKSSFSTLMPLISMPGEFIDNLTDDWGWQEGEKEIPVIVPTSVFNSYNFGIAEAANSPKITRELITKFRPRLRIGKSEWYNARIISFSDRFSDGVIVPLDFLKYANKKYSSTQDTKKNRIVISTPNAKNPALGEYISEKAYETNLEKIHGSKINETMNVLLPILLIVSLVIVLLSLLTFIQNAQLMLANSKYELNLLGLLGYSYPAVSRLVMKKFNRLFLLIMLLSVPLMILCKWIIDLRFEAELELSLGFGLGWITALSGLFIYGLFYAVQYRMIRNEVKRSIVNS